MKKKYPKEKKEIFLTELIEAKMDNAVDKYKFSEYWYFQKKVERPIPT